MIIDKLEKAELYYFLNRNLKSAFEFLKINDLSTFEPGKYNVDGDNVILIIAKSMPSGEIESLLEAHKKYIDIQMAISGSFGLKWKSLQDCNKIYSEYDSLEDATLFSDESDFEIMLNPGTFALLLPDDAHYPLKPKEITKKAIFKIKI